jgi:hypothetical protein
MDKSRALKVAGLVILFWFFVAPLLTFIHEVGHSILPLANGESVLIRVGGDDGSPVNVGSLSLVYAGPWQPWVGFTKWSGETQVARLAMGPLFSLALAIMSVALLRISKRWYASLLLQGAVCWTIGAVIVSSFPVDYPRFIIKSPIPMSDGKQIVKLLSSGQ